MKRFLLTLAAAALCASAAFADATVVIKDQTPYAAGQTTDAVKWTNGNFTFNPEKQDGQTAPSFNRAGDLRMYAKNTFTITTTGPEMTKIVFNISAAGLKRLTVVNADNGTIATQAKGDATVTWTGSSKNVVFTVAPEGEKAIYGTEDTKAGQLDFDKIEITGGGELGGDVPPVPEDPNFVKVTTVEDGASYALVAGGFYTAELFTKGYGYYAGTKLPDGAGDSFKGSEAGALKFTAVAGGYNITTAGGKFLGAKPGYNTFDTTDDSADNRVWTVTFNADGTATIVNVATGKTIGMEAPQYSSFGCYDAADMERMTLPTLYKYTGGEVVPPAPNTATFELVNAVSAGEFVFVVDGKVGEAIPASSSFGRLSLVEATFDGNKVTTAVGNIIKIAAANGGYTLQDANGRYLGFDGEHKTSFQLYTEVNEYTVWAIAMTNGEAAITMTVGETTGTVGVTKGTEGTWYNNIAPSVGADEIMLPKLYKKGGSSRVETITVDQNAPVEYFNLQGIRVENPANGLYIRRQGNNVAKVYIR